MRKRSNAVEEVASPDMTPMLDVVFIMLIFFIVTATFQQESGVEWSALEKTENPEPIKKQPLLVTINAINDLEVDGRFVDVVNLRDTVEYAKASGRYNGVVVNSHIEASAGVLVKAVDQIRLAGIESVVVTQSQ